MAYIGYDARVRVNPSRSQAQPARMKLAWGRLAAVAASLLAWVGIIEAARAVF